MKEKFQPEIRRRGRPDLVFSQSTWTGQLNDIFWAKGVPSLNPGTVTPVSISSTINGAGAQDNPHLERLSATNLVLLYDNHGAGDPDTEIRYSLSTDDGLNWSTPQLLSSINTSTSEEMHGHLFQDGTGDWWIYFASTRAGYLEIYRAQHLDNNLTGNPDAWGTAERVLSVGTVSGNYGAVIGLGEPTLTSDGDLYFGVVYAKNPTDQTDFDAYEMDPWYVPRVN